MATIGFIKYEVSIGNFDADSHEDNALLRQQLATAPEFIYVEATDGNVAFVDNYRNLRSQRRLSIEPAIGDEFNSNDVIAILMHSPVFRPHIAWIKKKVTGQLHAGGVFAVIDGSIVRLGSTFAGLRHSFKP